MSAHQLHIDWTLCTASGACIELLPDLLVADDWGFPLSAAGTDVPIPGCLLDDARLAVRLCPRLALRLESAKRSPQ